MPQTVTTDGLSGRSMHGDERAGDAPCICTLSNATTCQSLFVQSELDAWAVEMLQAQHQHVVDAPAQSSKSLTGWARDLHASSRSVCEVHHSFMLVHCSFWLKVHLTRLRVACQP